MFRTIISYLVETYNNIKSKEFCTNSTWEFSLDNDKNYLYTVRYKSYLVQMF